MNTKLPLKPIAVARSAIERAMQQIRQALETGLGLHDQLPEDDEEEELDRADAIFQLENALEELERADGDLLRYDPALLTVEPRAVQFSDL